MSHTSLDAQLDHLEDRLHALAACLLDGSPDLVQTASASLQILAVELLQTLNADGRNLLGSSGRTRRVRALAGGLAMVRESLLRQSAYVDRALELVVPTSQQQSTYAGNRTYGGPVRQSGAFMVLAA
jgi:hypothetical protein